MTLFSRSEGKGASAFGPSRDGSGPPAAGDGSPSSASDDEPPLAPGPRSWRGSPLREALLSIATLLATSAVVGAVAFFGLRGVRAPSSDSETADRALIGAAAPGPVPPRFDEPHRPVIARAGRSMVPSDTYNLTLLTSLEASPDGRSLVFVAEKADKQTNAFLHTLYTMPAGGGTPQRLVDVEMDPTSPRFSPSGDAIAFLGDGGDAAQIYVMKPGGKRLRQVTRGTQDVEEFDWSPDGKNFVFVRRDAPLEEHEGKVKSEDEPIVITRTQIQRDGEGYLDDRRSHVWIVPAAGGEETQVTSDPYDDADVQWSPDGTWIAFSSNRGTDPDASDNTDIYLVRPSGAQLHRVAANAGPDESPRFSHKGDRIAFIGRRQPNDYYQTAELMVVPVTGGDPLDLSASADTWVAADSLSAGSDAFARLAWSKDDSLIYCTLERRGANYLAAVPSGGGGPAREVLGGTFVLDLVRPLEAAAQSSRDSRGTNSLAGGASGQSRRAIAASATGGFVFALSSPTQPPEIYSARTDGTGLRQLSHLDSSLLLQLKLSAPRKILARDADGESIEGWLYPPVDLDPARKYPLILYIHGGPQTFDGDYFDAGLENQILPGRGYAVLRVNYRGSTSYGEKFCRAIYGDWHRREFDDLMAAVDQALREPWLDPARLGVGGWSYGGIMTVWIAGHTQRFKVGVPERFEVDYQSSFGEDQWTAQYLQEFGDPFQKEELYRRLSPIHYAQNIKTPMYLIANQLDGNCPLPQAMQFYQRLKVLGVDTQLVIYPGEPHSMTQPAHMVDRLDRLLGWFGKHLQ